MRTISFLACMFLSSLAAATTYDVTGFNMGDMCEINSPILRAPLEVYVSENLAQVSFLGQECILVDMGPYLFCSTPSNETGRLLLLKLLPIGETSLIGMIVFTDSKEACYSEYVFIAAVADKGELL